MEALQKVYKGESDQLLPLMPWNAGEADDTSRIVGILGGPQEHDKKAGGRWIWMVQFLLKKAFGVYVGGAHG